MNDGSTTLAIREGDMTDEDGHVDGRLARGAKRRAEIIEAPHAAGSYKKHKLPTTSRVWI